MLGRVLGSLGFVVRSCETAATCEEALAEHLPNVVMLGILLPDLDGLALTRRLHERYPTLRIVIVSILQAEQRALEAGADAFLSKPMSRPRLLAVLRTFFPALDTA